jgi:hypothetical protein
MTVQEKHLSIFEMVSKRGALTDRKGKTDAEDEDKPSRGQAIHPHGYWPCAATEMRRQPFYGQQKFSSPPPTSQELDGDQRDGEACAPTVSLRTSIGVNDASRENWL